MFFEYLNELFGRNIIQMAILFDPFLQFLRVIDQVFSKIGQIVKNSFVESEQVIYLAGYVLVDSFANETDKQISLVFTFPVLEDYIAMPVGLSEEEPFDDIAISSRAGTSQNHKFSCGLLA
jgi:hypothetical protein